MTDAAPGAATGSAFGGPSPVAVRLPLDTGPAIDPFALAGPTGIVFQSPDRLVVGLGCALSLPLPHGLDAAPDVDRLTAELAAIACEDRFDPGTSRRHGLREPAVRPVGPGIAGRARDRLRHRVLRRGVGHGRGPRPRAAAARVSRDTRLAAGRDRSPGGRGRPAPEAVPPNRDVGHGLRPAGSGPVISPRLSDASFEAMVAEAVRSVASDDVAKVVVARQVDVAMGEVIDVVALLHRWHRLEPTCSVFSLPTPDGQLVGASPELLVERSGRRVHSRPLAGTTDRANESDGVLPRELLSSVKDSAEHRMVVEAIGGALGPLCSQLDVPARPDLVHLHNITHLGTSVTGTLACRSDGSVPTALDLVAALHPTPAVGGVPRDRALALIDRLEPEDPGPLRRPGGVRRRPGRRLLDARHPCPSPSRDPTARLAAGVGVVEGSDPGTELVETLLKLTAAFDALAPGVRFTTGARPPVHRAVG